MTQTQKRILAVLAAVAGLLAVFLIAVLALGGSSGAKPSRVQVRTLTAGPSATATPLPRTATPAPTPTPPLVTARTRTPASVYTIPDTRGAIVAQLPPGLVLPVQGRSDDNQWLLVSFSTQGGAPSTGTGWLAASSAEVSGDLQQAPIAATVATPSPTPTPTPSPSPTPTPSPSPTPSPTPTRTPGPTPTRTPTPPPPATLPDLVLQDFSVIQSGAGAGFVQIVVGNVGQADVTQRQVEIVGVDQTGTEVMHFSTGFVNIPAGGSLNIRSGYKPSARTMLTVVVNPNHTIAEADAPPGFDDPNNALTRTVVPVP